ncbi:MAG: DNA-binding NarL/FixJ family response regulator [Sediminicola sp.]|jgi:DNA-binding NarL/FixJ family response regulator
MFKKVLISDDLDSINQGVLAITKTLVIAEVTQVQYCDDAFLKLKKGEMDGTPYDLLITDLSFKIDHRTQKYPSGDALITAVKQEYPQLKVIVYSVEDRLQRVRTLVKNYKVDAFVCKGRHGLTELSKAIEEVYNSKTYLSPQIQQALSDKKNLEIKDYDIKLILQLSKGMSQDEIRHLFEQENISPSSLSSIEKRLNLLRVQFKAKNAIHLVAIAKDLGLI